MADNNQAAQAIESWMVLRLSQELKLAPSDIDPSLAIISYGLDSIVAFTLTGELADWLGQDLSTTLFWEYPTIKSLSEYLAGELDVAKHAGLSGPQPTVADDTGGDLQKN